MERWVKWFCAAAAVATALSLYPFLAGESIEFRWWWYGFEADRKSTRLNSSHDN